MSNMKDYAEARANFDWEEVYASFDWDAPKHLNMAHEICERWVGDDATALSAERMDGTTEEFTFEEVDTIGNKVANTFETHGIERGDRVGSLLPMIPEVYQTIIGALKSGVVYMPAFQGLGVDAIKYRLRDSRAKGLVTTYGEVDRLRDILPSTNVETVFLVNNGAKETVGVAGDRWVDFRDALGAASDEYETARTGGDDVAFLQYTSGTTGKPKGCKAPHRMLAIHTVFGKYGLDLQPDDLFWCTADMGWATGPNLGMCAPWAHRVPVYQYEGEFDAAGVVSRLEEHEVTNFYSAPTAYRMMAQHTEIVDEADLSQLQHLCSVGEPLNSEIIEWAREHIGSPIHDTYGQTECGLSISNYPCLEVRPGSMGKPTPGFEVLLLDDDGEVIEEPGEVGEISYPTNLPMFLGYWERPDADEAVLDNGRYRSGDLAYMDEDGYYWYVSRADDIIITSGHRVSPFEIEDCLMEHQAVSEVGVVGEPDEVRGRIIKAYISTTKGHDPGEDLTADLQAFTKERLAAHEYPRAIEYMDDLPKTVSGKIKRHKLRGDESN